MTSTIATAPRVLADTLPGARVRDVLLTLGTTGLLIAAGQIAVPLPFTPVPLSLATFVVLLAGASLGPVRAASSVLLYLALGLAGIPVFADHAAGWAFASFGYILGYLASSVLVGHLARRRADRSLLGGLAIGGLGTLAVYACGVPWLAAFAGLDLPTALALGVAPFLIGDAIKIAVVAVALPTTWRLGARRFSGRR